jgi:putative FmdB family regulatory protein
MPTYEYICRGCDHAWETFQSIKDDALTDCPTCGAPKAKRQVSLGSGFILKGGGWYSDLYSSQPKGGASQEPKSDAPPTTSGTTTPAADKSTKATEATKPPASAEPANTSA